MKNLTIPQFDDQAAEAVLERLNKLAKVPGSLGRMEDLAMQLGGITANPLPRFIKKATVLFAGDHDITLKGVSATSYEVTTMQVINFVQGGGTINAYCRMAGADLSVVDVGMKDDINLPGLIKKNVVRSVKDFSEGPAMTREEALASLQVGIDMARQKAAEGYTLLAAGEMGIGNTSPSTAITALLCGRSVSEVTGIGSGIDAQRLKEKAAIIEEGLALNAPDPTDGLDILAKVGGAELGAMAGLMLGGASLRIPVVIDGFIAAAAAAIAIKLFPACAPMLISSHVSQEPGHKFLIEHFKMRPFLELNLRLGEGTGAVLLFPLVDAATNVLHEMITLEAMRKLPSDLQ